MTQLTWEKTLLSLSSWVHNILGTGKRNLFVALCFVDSPAERNALHPSMKKKNRLHNISEKACQLF